jgi:hypothetical protein
MTTERTLPRDEDGRLSAWAWPGGYAIYYLDKDNSVLCPDCARKSDEDPDELPNFRPIAAGIIEEYDEDDLTYCDNCSKPIR